MPASAGRRYRASLGDHEFARESPHELPRLAAMSGRDRPVGPELLIRERLILEVPSRIGTSRSRLPCRGACSRTHRRPSRCRRSISASSRTWMNRSRIGIVGLPSAPFITSWWRCSSDLKTSTFLVPISVVQKRPRRPACRAGVHPRRARPERREPDPHRRAAPDRLGDALPQAQALRLARAPTKQRPPVSRGPVATSSVDRQPMGQFTFTWMLLGFASGFFGRWTRSTPCFDSARIFSASMLAGSEKPRVNVP